MSIRSRLLLALGGITDQVYQQEATEGRCCRVMVQAMNSHILNFHGVCHNRGMNCPVRCMYAP